MISHTHTRLYGLGVAAAFLLAASALAQPTLRVVKLAEIDFEPRPDIQSPTAPIPSSTFGINNDTSGETGGNPPAIVFTIKGATHYRAHVALPLGGYGLAPGLYELPLPTTQQVDTVAHDVSDAGIIVGHWNGLNVGQGQAIFWNLNNWGTTDPVANLMNNPPDSSWSRAVAINNDGVGVVHGDETEDHFCSCDDVSGRAGRFVETSRAAIVTSPTYEPLEPLDCSTATDFHDLSEVGRDIRDGTDAIVGHTEDLAVQIGEICFTTGICSDVDRGVEWFETQPLPLDDIDSEAPFEGEESHARGINAAGNIAGFGRESISGSGCPPRAHVWESAGSLHVNLGATMPGGSGNRSRAEALNAADPVQVVGWDITDGRSVLWINDGLSFQNWTPHDLHGLIWNFETFNMVELPQAHDINDAGWIVVYAFDDDSNTDLAWLLVPIICAGDVDGDGIVGFPDLLAVLNAWDEVDACPDGDLCPADINSDGLVNFEDLLLILNAWGPCPGASGSADDCADRDLGQNCECRDTLTDLIENGTQAESANARCWLEHYLTCHDAQGCNSNPNCPDDDPCGKH